ncbi:MAG: helix-turn-helix domain-containing protein [Deltaproteobacteria bacterium]|nr:helix-turn-helix domain-containing protein [Deltaproteobacteria bacterium]
MDATQAARLFDVLSSEARLEIFRLLTKQAPGGLVAGEISKELNVAATNLSFHLKALVHGGLASVKREGRFLRYRAEIPAMLGLIGYLTSECCLGRPEKCLCQLEALGGPPICPKPAAKTQGPEKG